MIGGRETNAKFGDGVCVLRAEGHEDLSWIELEKGPMDVEEMFVLVDYVKWMFLDCAAVSERPSGVQRIALQDWRPLGGT